MRGSASRIAVALGAATALALAAWLIAGGYRALRPWLESPETGIRRALEENGRDAVASIAGGEGTLRLERLRFRDLLVTVREGGADVVAVADADGRVEAADRSVGVAYLGRERLAVVRCRREGWCLEGAPLPRLAALLATLLRRAQAFDRADAASYDPLVAEDYAGGKGALLHRLTADLTASPRAAMRPIAWQIRIERETAQVGEDYEVAVGGGAARRLRAARAARRARALEVHRRVVSRFPRRAVDPV